MMASLCSPVALLLRCAERHVAEVISPAKPRFNKKSLPGCIRFASFFCKDLKRWGGILRTRWDLEVEGSFQKKQSTVKSSLESE